MAGSPLPLLTWLYAIYLDVTSLKGVSSMKLHRDLGVTQKTAWLMLQRIREAFSVECGQSFVGPVEIDETYIGGKRKNMPKAKRAKMEGRGTVGKTAIVGAKDRATNRVSAKVLKNTKSETLSRFVMEHVTPETKLYTDDATAYSGFANHESVKHSIMEYVRGEIHTNGIESFWSMLKRSYIGTFHHFSAKHCACYLSEFVGRHNMRQHDTINQMELLVAYMIGRRLMYRDLIS